MAIENRGPELQAAASVLVSSAIIATLLRCYVRIFKVKKFGFDDWSMVFATVSRADNISPRVITHKPPIIGHIQPLRHVCSGWSLLWDRAAPLGSRARRYQHSNEGEEMNISTKRRLPLMNLQYWWFCYIWYCLTMIGSKISIGYFLLRITVRRIDIWIITGVMLVTVLTGIVFFFLTIFQCQPVAYFWNKDLDGFCINVEIIIAMTYLYSSFSVICDFTFALLPIALIWKLNMNRSSKWALVPIMTMACV